MSMAIGVHRRRKGPREYSYGWRGGWEEEWEACMPPRSNHSTTPSYKFVYFEYRATAVAATAAAAAAPSACAPQLVRLCRLSYVRRPTRLLGVSKCQPADNHSFWISISN
eukprot:4053201-Pleurochrysis_carterae.AAC.1